VPFGQAICGQLFPGFICGFRIGGGEEHSGGAGSPFVFVAVLFVIFQQACAIARGLTTLLFPSLQTTGFPCWYLSL
jgi:hypothetical protein